MIIDGCSTKREAISVMVYTYKVFLIKKKKLYMFKPLLLTTENI